MAIIRIDTDRFIACGACSEVEHFGNVSIEKARELAKRFGWLTVEGEPRCPACQEKKETSDAE